MPALSAGRPAAAISRDAVVYQPRRIFYSSDRHLGISGSGRTGHVYPGDYDYYLDKSARDAAGLARDGRNYEFGIEFRW